MSIVDAYGREKAIEKNPLLWDRDNTDKQCPGSEEVALIPFILTTVEGKMINLQKGSDNKPSGGKPSLEEK